MRDGSLRYSNLYRINVTSIKEDKAEKVCYTKNVIADGITMACPHICQIGNC